MAKATSTSRKIVFGIALGLFVVYTVYILFFFAFAILIALKEDMIAFTMDQLECKLFSLPKKANWMNFIHAFEEWNKIDPENTYISMTWNSIWRSSLGTLINWVCTAMVCYILVFYRSKFTKFIYNLGLVIAILPLYGASGSTYRLMTQLGLINTPLRLILNIGLFGGYFFYIYAFWKSLSWDYAEAAFIDGANHYSVFFRIMFPMAVPSMMALFIMSFIASWNDYSSTLLYMTKYPDLSYGVYAYSEISKYNANIPAYFAGVIISLLPVLTLFIVFQNSIMEKVHLGGLKG